MFAGIHVSDGREVVAAMRATGVRPRRFYSTRATFISTALTRGVNLKWLAEYCGTSVAMIERSYGKFLAAGADHQLALLAEPSEVGRLRSARPSGDWPAATTSARAEPSPRLS